MPLDATPGGANADTYITLLDATTYFDNMRVNSTAWDDSLVQEELLRQACLIIDQYDYIGVVSSATQALKWPRYADDGVTLIRNFAINVNPTPIRYAQCEVALWLAQTGGTAVAAGTVDTLKIGNSVEVKYAAGSSGEVVDLSVDPTGLPIQAARFLKGLRLIPVLA